jgi:hypothetical protein
VQRLGSVAVDNGGDQVGAAGPACGALAEFGADLGSKLLLSHEGVSFLSGSARTNGLELAGAVALKEGSDRVDNGAA